MDRGAWQATSPRGHERVRHGLAAKQQKQKWRAGIYPSPGSIPLLLRITSWVFSWGPPLPSVQSSGLNGTDSFHQFWGCARDHSWPIPMLYALEKWLFPRGVFSQTKRESVLQFHWNLGTAHSFSQELLGWLPISLVLLVAMLLPPEMKPAFRKAEGRDETEIPVTSSECLDSAMVFSS